MLVTCVDYFVYKHRRIFKFFSRIIVVHLKGTLQAILKYSVIPGADSEEFFLCILVSMCPTPPDPTLNITQYGSFPWNVPLKSKHFLL